MSKRLSNSGEVCINARVVGCVWRILTKFFWENCPNECEFMAPRVFLFCVLSAVGLLVWRSVGKCNCTIAFQLVNNWMCGSILFYINCHSVQYGCTIIAVVGMCLKMIWRLSSGDGCLHEVWNCCVVFKEWESFRNGRAMLRRPAVSVKTSVWLAMEGNSWNIITVYELHVDFLGTGWHFSSYLARHVMLYWPGFNLISLHFRNYATLHCEVRTDGHAPVEIKIFRV